jgi:hypothetical protein
LTDSFFAALAGKAPGAGKTNGVASLVRAIKRRLMEQGAKAPLRHWFYLRRFLSMAQNGYPPFAPLVRH